MSLFGYRGTGFGECSQTWKEGVLLVLEVHFLVFMSDQTCGITERQPVPTVSAENQNQEMDDLGKRYEEMERKYLELQQSSASAPAEESAESYVVWEEISLPIIQITPSSGQITRKNTAAQTLLGDVELFEEILPLVTLTPFRK